MHSDYLETCMEKPLMHMAYLEQRDRWKNPNQEILIFFFSNSRLLFIGWIFCFKKLHSILFAWNNCEIEVDKGDIGYELSYTQKWPTLPVCSAVSTVRTCNGTGKKVKVALKSHVSTLTLAAAEFSRHLWSEATAEQVVLWINEEMKTADGKRLFSCCIHENETSTSLIGGHNLLRLCWCKSTQQTGNTFAAPSNAAKRPR